MSTTSKPISGKKNDFALVEPTLANEEKIHAIQVAYPRIDIEERKAICELQKWDPETRIPELSHDYRIAVSALVDLQKRTSPEQNKGKDTLRDELKKLTDDFTIKSTVSNVPGLSPKEYWYQMACALFVEFSCSEEEKANLNFKVIEQAHTDFFG